MGPRGIGRCVKTFVLLVIDRSANYAYRNNCEALLATPQDERGERQTMTEEALQQLWKSYQDAWADFP